MKKQKRGTPARRKRKAKPSSALVRVGRGKTTVAELVRELPAGMSLTSDPMVSAVSVGIFKLTPDQINALRRKVEDVELDWKPAVTDGAPIIPYLSHNGYRDRLDAAFGLGGWGMMPTGQPKREGDKFIYVPYALVVDGMPRIYTWGEQQIHKMTYGDALEGCKSNAIVRCGKELGIARELWDKRHVEELLARKGKAGSVPANGQARGSSPRAGYNASEAEPITLKQRQRLVMIVKNSGRTEFEVLQFLREMFDAKGTKDIKRGDYEAICTAIERPGELPRPPAPSREPGEEG